MRCGLGKPEPSRLRNLRSSETTLDKITKLGTGLVACTGGLRWWSWARPWAAPRPLCADKHHPPGVTWGRFGSEWRSSEGREHGYYVGWGSVHRPPGKV